MSSIIKAERLVIAPSYTLVGEEIDFSIIADSERMGKEFITGRAVSKRSSPGTKPDSVETAEEVTQLQEEAERILQETEEMVVEIMERARGEAGILISNAREEANNILLAAEQEAARLKAQALEEGHREGLQLAFREMEEQRRKARQEYEQLVNEGVSEKARLIRSAETEVVNLAMAVAEKIISREIKTDPSIILDIVREALELAGEAENVRVMVSSEDAEMVKDFIPQLIKPDQNLGDITIEGDPRIEQGGCLVETENGIIDARLQTRYLNIANQVQEGLSHV